MDSTILLEAAGNSADTLGNLACGLWKFLALGDR